MAAYPRIVHVTSAHPANDPRIFEKECTTLAAAGYDVHLVATGTPLARAGVTVTTVPRPSSRLLRMTVGSFLATIRAMRTGARIVHLHDPELALWIPLLRVAGRKVIFDSHEDIAASVSTKEYLPPPLRVALTLVTQFLVRFIDASSTAVVSATPAISKRFGNPHACVVQNFPVLSEFPEKPADAQVTRLLYIGGLSRARGARQMVEAMSLVASTHPSVSLTIAGTIPDELLAELGSLSGWRQVDFVGMLDRGGVNRLLADSAIGLVLFQPEPNHVASQPTKMFEYMIGGLAIVASDFPHWRSLVVETGVGRVVDPSDTQSIARAICDLVDAPQTVYDMGLRARAVVARDCNWEIEGAKLLALYSTIGALR